MDAKLERYLRRIVEADRIEINQLAKRARPAGLEGAGHGLTEEAVESLDRFVNGRELRPGDDRMLEAVVLPNGLRPVFDIAKDSFADLPEPWKELNLRRTFLDSCIRGIGRINLSGRPNVIYGGTAFVVGPNLLLTNRHVAELFCEQPGGQLTFISGITANVDLLQEVGNPEERVLQAAAPVLILKEWDAALFTVTGLPSGVVPLPLAGNAPADPAKRLATIIGYPALDSTVGIEYLMQQIQIFRGTFDKKRLQPGRLMGIRPVTSYSKTVQALAHDCSTLGGNSGSALIDVAAQAVVGLHFAGEYLTANYSVPTWELAQIAAVRNAGAQFQNVF